MGRYDPHRPSAIIPDDYEFVAQEVLKIEGLGDAEIMRWNREQIREHMARTEGRYSSHEHGGNCMVCGSVNAVYTVLFWHRPSNTYVRMGADCAEKCDMGGDYDASAFRAAVRDALAAQAGKRKAQALLADAGLSQAWEIAQDHSYAGCTCRDDCDCYRRWAREHWEEDKIAEVVSSVVRYGALSDKQATFLHTLLGRITTRPERLEAERREREAATPCPSGRCRIVGEVLSVRVDDGMYGPVTKCLVKAEGGFKVWGTRPSGTNAEPGDRIAFTATVQPSETDPLFGFFSRPAKAEVLQRAHGTTEAHI